MSKIIEPGFRHDNPRPRAWVCSACGKMGEARDQVGDESCFMHAVEIYVDSVELCADGRVRRAEAVS